MSKIKSSLKNRDGAALPMVLIVMLILTMLGTALCVLAFNSLRTVQYMDDQKRAYYFARGGVEAAAYAYQATETASEQDAKDIITFSKGSGAKLTTNTIYVVPKVGAGSGAWTGLEFVAADSKPSNAIGEFTVEIGKGIENQYIMQDGEKVPADPKKVVVFKSTAKSYRGNGSPMTQSTIGYLVTSETTEPKTFYDDNGILANTGYTADDVKDNKYTAEQMSNMFAKTHKKVEWANIDTTPTSNRRFFIFRFIEVVKKRAEKAIFKWIFGDGIEVDLFAKTVSGNLILAKPARSNVIRTRDNTHNYYIFASEQDLFLRDCGIDATPTKGYYNSVGLYGDEIVVDGNITVAAYYVKPSGMGSLGDGSIADKVTSIVNTFGRRYRLGTVMIGEGSNIPTTRYDKVPAGKGGIQFDGKSVPANKIYFNGNVVIKIYSQGAATETYRIFNAGDVAYFYGGYNETDGDGNAEARGLDLLKYFIDAVIDGKEGFHYGSGLIQKMKVLNELYYTGTVSDAAYKADSNDYTETQTTKYDFLSGDPTPYFNDETVLVRKIQVNKTQDGQYEVDKIGSTTYGSVLDIIQPAEISSKQIKWGNPDGGSVFKPASGKTESDY